ncbi:hypothetical protein AAC387_Pa11g1687 [Persea americana]
MMMMMMMLKGCGMSPDPLRGLTRDSLNFELSLNGPEIDEQHLSMRVAERVGYMDSEYYELHHLIAQSDIYGLGVVKLEVLTGRRAIFKDEEGDGRPMSVVDYAVPKIMGGELTVILKARVGMPELNEAEAVELADISFASD